MEEYISNSASITIPQDIERKKRSLRHALTTLVVLKKLDAGSAQRPTTLAELQELIEKGVSLTERQVSGEAVVKGAITIVGAVSGEKVNSDNLFFLINRWRERIQEYAAAMGIESPRVDLSVNPSGRPSS
jgi:hypothetical protein